MSYNLNFLQVLTGTTNKYSSGFWDGTYYYSNRHYIKAYNTLSSSLSLIDEDSHNGSHGSIQFSGVYAQSSNKIFTCGYSIGGWEIESGAIYSIINNPNNNNQKDDFRNYISCYYNDIDKILYLVTEYSFFNGNNDEYHLGISVYDIVYDHSSGGIDYYDFNLIGSDFSFVTTDPSLGAYQAFNNNIIEVNGYIIASCVGRGLVSFSVDGSGNITVNDTISSTTLQYAQDVNNYNDWIFFTDNRNNLMKKTQLQPDGTFGTISNVSGTGMDYGSIYIRENFLYVGRTDIRKFSIDASGNTSYITTYQIEDHPDIPTNTYIHDIVSISDGDYLLIETDEGRIYAQEELPLSSSGKNRIMFIT